SGSKDTVSIGDTLKVNYVGRLLNNRAFDTSFEDIAKDEGIYNSQRDYDPLVFRVGIGQLIAGFVIGTLQMEDGDKATEYITSFVYRVQQVYFLTMTITLMYLYLNN